MGYEHQLEAAEEPVEENSITNQVDSAQSAIVETTSQQIGDEVHEYVEAYQMEGIAPERRLAIEKNLAQIANILDGLGKPWFLSGGLALELSHGDIQRDHQDIDVAMYKADGQVLAALTAMGYSLRSHDGQIIAVENLAAQDQPNAFAIPSESTDLPAFEIIFLGKDEQGEVLFGSDQSLSFPATSYEQPTIYQNRDSKQIPLTPPEIQLLYKLYDGRLRDFLDIKTTLPTLSIPQRQRLGEYLQNLGVKFTLPSGEVVNQPEGLLASGASLDSIRDELLSGNNIKEHYAEQLQGYVEVAKDVYVIGSTSSSKENFSSQMAQHFGTEAATTHAELIDKMYDFLHHTTEVSNDDFTAFFLKLYHIPEMLTDRVKNETIRNLTSTSMWTTTSRSKRY